MAKRRSSLMEMCTNPRYFHEKLTEAAVNNLRAFGYPDCTVENITTVKVFREFFRKMLEETAEESSSISIRSAAKELLAELKD